MNASKAANWEAKMTGSWTGVMEDDSGRIIQPVEHGPEHASLSRIGTETAKACKRGFIRHVVLVIDSSDSSGACDWQPTLLDCIIEFVCSTFVPSFFDQNPLGQLSVLFSKNGLAEIVCPMTGHPDTIIESLRSPEKPFEPAGYASIQNSLLLAQSIFRFSCHFYFRSCSSLATKEVMILYCSLLTLDPSDIFDSIESIKKDSIRVSFISISGALSIGERICLETNGNFQFLIFRAFCRSPFV